MKVIRGKTAEVVSFISSPITWVKSMLFLEEENQYLREKVIVLSLQAESMMNLQNENNQLVEMLGFKQKTNLFLVPARVVNKGLQPGLLSVIIDVGSDDGVKENQPVLTPKGIIGKTVDIGKTSSVVQLITDMNYRISVRILPSGATGILGWLGGGKAQIREVQKNVEINIGDRVVTSGFSDIYPSGLPVGDVSGIYDVRGNYQKIIDVDLPYEISAFQYVFVIVDKPDELD